jgi:hypothetical protein
MPLAPMRTILLAILASLGCAAAAQAGHLRAGVARIEITDRDHGPVNDPSFVKALVLSDGSATAAVITVDVVAVGASVSPTPTCPACGRPSIATWESRRETCSSTPATATAACDRTPTN